MYYPETLSQYCRLRTSTKTLRAVDCFSANSYLQSTSTTRGKRTLLLYTNNGLMTDCQCPTSGQVTKERERAMIAHITAYLHAKSIQTLTFYTVLLLAVLFTIYCGPSSPNFHCPACWSWQMMSTAENQEMVLSGWSQLIINITRNKFSLKTDPCYCEAKITQNRTASI